MALDRIPFDSGTLDGHLVHHPQLVVMDRRVDAALAAVRSAEASRKADWSVELAFQQRGPAFSNMVSVGVSVPLQWDRRNRQDRDVAAKVALADQARADREEAQRTHVAETRVMIEEWDNGQERIGRFERELLPLAAKACDGCPGRLSWRQGRLVGCARRTAGRNGGAPAGAGTAHGERAPVGATAFPFPAWHERRRELKTKMILISLLAASLLA
ncbi:TolC family protein [Massilia sp. H-1]|nr:TolC family protein [Massilia sp. H-1]